MLKAKTESTFIITRDIIEVASVKSEIIDDKTGYLRLTSFNENSGDQIKDKIKEFKKNGKVKNYIVFMLQLDKKDQQ